MSYQHQSSILSTIVLLVTCSDGSVLNAAILVLQALFGEDTETKLPVQIAKRKLILQAVGDDAPSQMAQLLALEYLTGVTDTDRLTQVCAVLTALYTCTVPMDGLGVLYGTSSHLCKNISKACETW